MLTLLTIVVAIFFLGMGVLAVAVALAGMAAGRLVAAAIERPASVYPSWFYFTVEAAMAVVPLAASDPGAWL